MGNNKYVDIAVKAALAGGKVLMKYFNTGLAVEYKGRIDPVTAADKTSQKVITAILKKEFPGHSVIGEEDVEKKACSEYCWVIDPLDGTVNYIHDIPFFCVSIALIVKGKTAAGAIYAPRLNELFTARRGAGAFLNGKRIAVSPNDRIVRSLVVTGFPYDIRAERRRVMESLSKVLSNAQGVRRLGSAAMDLAYVASGRFDAFWEKGLKAWDVAAGALIVQEAGGKVTEFDGGKNYIFGNTILASNGKIHSKMINMIK